MPILAIYALIVVAIFGAGFGSGFHTKSVIDTSKYTKELQIELAKQTKQVQIIHDVEKVYIQGEEKTNTVYKTVTKEVIKYVPQVQVVNSECNLTRGTVRLLNSNVENKLPITTRESDATDTESSTITERKHIDYTNEIIAKYNLMKNQCNSLIEYNKSIAELTKTK